MSDYVTTCEHEYPITQTDGAGIPYMGCMDCDWRDYDADDLESAATHYIEEVA